MLLIGHGKGGLYKNRNRDIKEYQYIIQYHDNYTNENELDAKIKFRLRNDFSDTKRYTIISVEGVKK